MLQFDVSSLIRDILKECTLALKQVGEKAKQAMIYELSSHAGAGAGTTGASQWNRQVGEAIDFIAENTTNEAIVKVGLVNSQNDFDTLYKSLLINYGTGSEMSRENPFLAAYLVSDMYNSARGNDILTRPNDEVYDPDQQRFVSASERPGANPERKMPEKFSQPPTYFFENAMQRIVYDFNTIVEGILDNFNFSRYLKSTSR